jgi:hypothetical protein
LSAAAREVQTGAAIGEGVDSNRLIVHAPGLPEVRANVRSVLMNRPWTGNWTSAHSTLKTASSGVTRVALERQAESPGMRRVAKSTVVVTKV